MQYKRIQLRNGKRIVIPIPENLKDCFLLIKSDLYRILGREVTSWYILKRLVFHPLSSTLMWFRLSNYGKSNLLYYPCRLMYRVCSRRHNIHIPFTTTIGYGLYIGHETSIVIHDKTIIANNVNISHFVTIGSNFNTPATISDCVYIGPNSCIVEDVIVGENAIIGAGSVVTKDVPSNSTFAGAPAKIIKEKNSHNFIHNKWIKN